MIIIQEADVLSNSTVCLIKVPLDSWEEDIENAAKVDEWIWMTRLVHAIQTDSSEKFKDERVLVDQIYNLETEFWSGDIVSRRPACFQSQCSLIAPLDRPSAVWRLQQSWKSSKSYGTRNTPRAASLATNLNSQRKRARFHVPT